MTKCSCGCNAETTSGLWLRGHYMKVPGRKWSEKTKEKVSLNKNFGMRGKKHSEQTREKIRQKALGRVFDPEKGIRHSLTLKDWYKRNISPNLGKRAWNKGLTKETDKRVNQYAQSIKIALQSNPRLGKKNPMWGKHHNQISKEKIGKAVSSRIMSKGNIYTKGKRGIVNGYVLRSSWELAFAIHLNKQKILWEYERKRFGLSDGRIYIPDFFAEGIFYEIKGQLRISDREKIDLFRKGYPEFGFKLITDTEIVPLLRIYKKEIAEAIDSFDHRKKQKENGHEKKQI